MRINAKRLATISSMRECYKRSVVSQGGLQVQPHLQSEQALDKTPTFVVNRNVVPQSKEKNNNQVDSALKRYLTVY